MQTKRLLLVVDMVNGFVTTGKMHDERIMRVVPAQLQLIQSFQKSRDDIVFFADTHTVDSSELRKFPEHCLSGNEESMIIDALKPYADTIYPKNSTCGLFAPGFLKDLSLNTSLKEIVVVGCCTDICVLNLVLALVNYFDEQNKEITITVPKNAVETYHSDTHPAVQYNEMAFLLMKQSGVVVCEQYQEERAC